MNLRLIEKIANIITDNVLLSVITGFQKVKGFDIISIGKTEMFHEASSFAGEKRFKIEEFSSSR